MRRGGHLAGHLQNEECGKAKGARYQEAAGKGVASSLLIPVAQANSHHAAVEHAKTSAILSASLQLPCQHCCSFQTSRHRSLMLGDACV